MRTDWVGVGFEQLKRNGEDIDMVFAGRFEGSRDLEWLRVPHSEADGLGATVRILREFGYAIREIPTVPGLRRPGGWKTLVALFRYLRDSSNAYRIPWDRPRIARPLRAHPAIGWWSFEVEESRRIRAVARERKVSLNALLLEALHATAVSRYASAATSGRWLLPYNLRGALDGYAETANQASFLAVDVETGGTANALHERIERQIARGYPWGSWLSLNLIRWIGQERVRAAQARAIASGKSWMGAFANVGAWPARIAIEEESTRKLELFFGCPPALTVLPIALTTVIWKGRLTFAAQIHASLDPDPEAAQEFVDGFVERLRSLI